MNKLIKLLALSLIAVLAAVSCAPELSVSSHEWETLNSYSDPENISTTNNARFLPTVGNVVFKSAANLRNPTIAITFPAEADILTVNRGKKSSDIKAFMTAELIKFMDIHMFEQPNVADWQQKAMTSNLLTPIEFEFVNINGRVITVELKRDFTPSLTDPVNFSDLVVRFDSATFTHSGGIKMDTDNDGEAGTIYDILYCTSALSVAVQGLKAADFVAPGQRNWYIQLNDVTTAGPFAFPAAIQNKDPVTASNTVAEFVIATIVLGGIDQGNDNDKAYREVGALFANSFELQKLNYATGAFEKVAASEYDVVADTADAKNTRIIIKDVKADHGNLYRTYWKGTFKTTTSEYFGVKQRVYVNGGTPTADPVNLRGYLARTEAATTWTAAFNSELYQEITEAPVVELLTSDTNGRKVVLKLSFRLLEEGFVLAHRVGLSKSITESLFKGDDAAFKIIRPPVGGTAWANDVAAYTAYQNNNYRAVGINKVVFANEGTGFELNWENPNDERNVIYITLDPEAVVTNTGDNDFTRIRFLINDKFGYEGNKPERKFGSSANYNEGKYRVYNRTANFPNPTPPVEEAIPDAPLVINVAENWNISSLSRGTGQRRDISFDVIKGNWYEVKFDSLNSGSGTYFKQIAVAGASTSDWGAFIDTITPGATWYGTLGSYTAPYIFKAANNGRMTLRVTTSSINAGNFAVKVIQINEPARNTGWDSYTVGSGWKEYELSERSTGGRIVFNVEGAAAPNTKSYRIQLNELGGDGKYTKNVELGINNYDDGIAYVAGTATVWPSGAPLGIGDSAAFNTGTFLTSSSAGTVHLEVTSADGSSAGKFAVKITEREKDSSTPIAIANSWTSSNLSYDSLGRDFTFSTPAVPANTSKTYRIQWNELATGDNVGVTGDGSQNKGIRVQLIRLTTAGGGTSETTIWDQDEGFSTSQRLTITAYAAEEAERNYIIRVTSNSTLAAGNFQIKVYELTKGSDVAGVDTHGTLVNTFIDGNTLGRDIKVHVSGSATDPKRYLIDLRDSTTNPGDYTGNINVLATIGTTAFTVNKTNKIYTINSEGTLTIAVTTGTPGTFGVRIKELSLETQNALTIGQWFESRLGEYSLGRDFTFATAGSVEDPKNYLIEIKDSARGNEGTYTASIKASYAIGTLSTIPAYDSVSNALALDLNGRNNSVFSNLTSNENNNRIRIEPSDATGAGVGYNNTGAFAIRVKEIGYDSKVDSPEAITVGEAWTNSFLSEDSLGRYFMFTPTGAGTATPKSYRIEFNDFNSGVNRGNYNGDVNVFYQQLAATSTAEPSNTVTALGTNFDVTTETPVKIRIAPGARYGSFAVRVIERTKDTDATIAADGQWHTFSLKQHSLGKDLYFNEYEAGASYRVQWDDANQGSGNFTKGISVGANYSEGTNTDYSTEWLATTTQGYTSIRTIGNTLASAGRVRLAVTASGTNFAAGNFAVRITKLVKDDSDTITLGAWKPSSLSQLSEGRDISFNVDVTAGSPRTFRIQWDDYQGSGKFKKDILVSVRGDTATTPSVPVTYWNNRNEGFRILQTIEVTSSQKITITVTSTSATGSLDATDAGSFELRVTEMTKDANGTAITAVSLHNNTWTEYSISENSLGIDIPFTVPATADYRFRLDSGASPANPANGTNKYTKLLTATVVRVNADGTLGASLGTVPFTGLTLLSSQLTEGDSLRIIVTPTRNATNNWGLDAGKFALMVTNQTPLP